MIKLQDFARQQGVTDRAIQKHLKTYAAELEGLFQRKGPNGTWLTEEACNILRSKMKQAPITIMEPDARVGELMDRIKELENRLDEKDKLLILSQGTAQAAQEQVLKLQEDLGQVKLLEGFVADAKAEIAVLSNEKAEAERKAKDAANDAQKAQDELTVAQERERELREYLAALEAWNALSGWKRRNKKKHPKPAAPEWLKGD